MRETKTAAAAFGICAAFAALLLFPAAQPANIGAIGHPPEPAGDIHSSLARAQLKIIRGIPQGAMERAMATASQALSGVLAPAAPSRAFANSTVVVSGHVAGKLGPAPLACAIVALGSNNVITNITSTDASGFYSIALPAGKDAVLAAVTRSGATVGGYYLHAYVPLAKAFCAEPANATQDFALDSGFTLVLEEYGAGGGLVPEGNFTVQKFATDLNDRAAYSVFSGTSKGSGTTVPALVAPLGKPVKILSQHEVPGYGRVMLRADNGGNGWSFGGIDGSVLNLNYEFAKTRSRMLAENYTVAVGAGCSFSQEVKGLMSQAGARLADASALAGAGMAQKADESLNFSLWASEKLVLEKAQQDIKKNRMGTLDINFLDGLGAPVALANSTVNIAQTGRDFDFGIFGNLGAVENATYRKLAESGMNYLTAGLYWAATEPNKGQIEWDYINNTIGVLDFDGMGFKQKAHALGYYLPSVVPQYLEDIAAANFTQLNETAYSHVAAIASQYRDLFDVWEMSNEASGIEASLGLSRQQMTFLAMATEKAIRDSAPNATVSVNSALDWWGQSKYASYLFGENADNFTLAVPDFLGGLLASGITPDCIEQQMYGGGHADFYGQPHPDQPSYDYLELGAVADRLDSCGIPVRVSEQEVSGAWNDSWAGAGYIHSKWSPQSQADFVSSFYPLMFSKRNFVGITWRDASDNGSFLAGGGLYDSQGRAKPSANALAALISGWTTGISANAAGGKYSCTVYGGTYDISVVTSLPGKPDKYSNFTGVCLPERAAGEINITLDTSNMAADVQVISVSHFPQYPTDAAPTQVNVTLYNAGPVSKPGVEWQLLQNGTIVAGGTADIAAGATVEKTYSTALAEGAYNFTAVADPNGTLNDPYRGNNRATGFFSVRNGTAPPPPAYWPDLSVTAAGITCSLQKIYEGDPVTFKASVENIGDYTAAIASVEFFDGDPDAGAPAIGAAKQAPALAPGENTTISSDPWVSAVVGNHTVTVRIASVVPNDDNLSNNIGSRIFAVLQVPPPPPKPDLLVSAVALSNSTPAEGAKVTITATVSNIGAAPVTGAVVRFLAGSVVIGSQTLGALAPGKVAWVQAAWTAAVGTRAITAVADPLNAIAESDEQNNAATAALTVTKKSAGTNSGQTAGAADYYDICGIGFGITIIVIALIAAAAVGGRKK